MQTSSGEPRLEDELPEAPMKPRAPAACLFLANLARAEPFFHNPLAGAFTGLLLEEPGG